MLPCVEGKWRNIPKTPSGTTLWERLTAAQKETSPNAVVMLEIPDKRTLMATLLTDGAKTDSRIFKIRQRATWFEFPAQYTISPLLWYVVWILGYDGTSIGVNANGDLWGNTIYNSNMVIMFIPFFGAGGGDGTVNLYERVP